MRVPIPTNADIGRQLTVRTASPLSVVWARASNYLGDYDDTTRSTAPVVNTGDFIFNHDDNTFNIWDASVSDWRNPRGVLT